MANPFDAVYGGLWSLIEAYPTIDMLIKPGNRVKFDAQGQMVPPVVADADLPELILSPATTNANLRSTSNSTQCTRVYEWIISTGSQQLTDKIYAVEWAIFITHLKWNTTLTALLHNGTPYVKQLRIVSAQTGISDRELNRGIKGWSAIWRVEVDMHFSTAALVAELTP